MTPGLHCLLPLYMLALLPFMYRSKTMDPSLHCLLPLDMLALVPSQDPGPKLTWAQDRCASLSAAVYNSVCALLFCTGLTPCIQLTMHGYALLLCASAHGTSLCCTQAQRHVSVHDRCALHPDTVCSSISHLDMQHQVHTVVRPAPPCGA